MQVPSASGESEGNAWLRCSSHAHDSTDADDRTRHGCYTIVSGNLYVDCSASVNGSTCHDSADANGSANSSYSSTHDPRNFYAIAPALEDIQRHLPSIPQGPCDRSANGPIVAALMLNPLIGGPRVLLGRDPETTPKEQWTQMPKEPRAYAAYAFWHQGRRYIWKATSRSSDIRDFEYYTLSDSDGRVLAACTTSFEQVDFYEELGKELELISLLGMQAKRLQAIYSSGGSGGGSDSGGPGGGDCGGGHGGGGGDGGCGGGGGDGGCGS
ncbi:uncharacterized protein RCC_00189 [Ramularia collo-cygni]|uniref:Uncharacterized protein n=1 Tax=Ramularia collo-cygni TaxID=112498 RepID=A0A2D3UNU0_9PEZI|nr:uncharacterized protein RCC_00189 [Ramularia collo-cygni]CZT14215.1 uncharacterized protein RCC_00189 [Ramularia collo-cygni]